LVKRRFAVFLASAVLSLGLAWLAASRDWCGPGQAGAPSPVERRSARGLLRVGVGLRPLLPRYPIVVAGYGPWRSQAAESTGLAARATVLEVRGVRFGWVVFDTLLVPTSLVRAVRADRDFPVWVTAAHTHSSLGAYDRRPASQAAAVGTFRADAETLLVAAAREALDAAIASLAPATLEVTGAPSQDLSYARSGDSVDSLLTRLRFVGAAGAPLAQWLILSAHPTLVDRRTTRLDADYPGRVATRAERAGPLTFVLQGAGGNASANLGDGEALDGYADRVRASFDALAPSPAAEEVELTVASTTVGLPHPDGSRLVSASAWVRAPIENALCLRAEPALEVSTLRLGSVTLLAVPLEPAHRAGAQLATAAGATRVVGNTNGYLGYVETAAAVEQSTGEAHHQYFGPELLSLLEAAAQRIVAAGAGATPAAKE
jgi:neutral ceramidase